MEKGQPPRVEPGVGQTYSVASSTATNITNLYLLKKERSETYQTGLQYSEVKLQWITAIQDKRQMLGDDNVKLACSTIQKITESIDEALDNAYMAGILASDESTNEDEPLVNQKPIPLSESVTFHQTQLSASQKPKMLRRAIHLVSKALQLYQEFDNI